MGIPSIDGFYVGYFTAAAGNGVVLFVIQKGDIVGADLTTHFDGKYSWDEERRVFSGKMEVRLKPGGMTVQGIPTGSNGLQYEVPLALPANFFELPFVSIATPLGPVNARFEKIRGL